MFEQLQLLFRRQFVIQRDQHPPAVKNSVGGNQPLRLIRHEDRRAVSRVELGILQRPGQGQADFFEVGIGKPRLFPVAIGFDQAGLTAETVQGVAQRRAQTAIFSEIEH